MSCLWHGGYCDLKGILLFTGFGGAVRLSSDNHVPNSLEAEPVLRTQVSPAFDAAILTQTGFPCAGFAAETSMSRPAQDLEQQQCIANSRTLKEIINNNNKQKEIYK